MQEVFENLVKNGVDMIEDALQHTDVIRLLNDIKVQQAIYENEIKVIENKLNCIGPHDSEDDNEMEIELMNLAGQVEFAQYVIDVIESGKFVRDE